MSITYDKYYQTENLFGEPYPELIKFFMEYLKRDNVLDLGCGQGRDALALARLGYTVTGIDQSKVGIDQMNRVGKTENLKLIGHVLDIYAFEDFEDFDTILLDSMFHFEKRDIEKEVGLLKKIVSRIRNGSLIVICIQDMANKIEILRQAIGHEEQVTVVADRKFKYTYEDQESGHKSETDYRMIVVQKN